MENIREHIKTLYEKDNKVAYKSLKVLEAESEKSNAVYPFFDEFVDMMESDHSYVRTRGLLLISQNAKWDTENKIDKIIDGYLNHVLDEKPITARQCIKGLQNIVEFKAELILAIQTALLKADTSKYEESMQSLINRDIASVLKKIDS